MNTAPGDFQSKLLVTFAHLHPQPTSIPHNPAAAINRSYTQPTSLPHNPAAAINRSHPQPTSLPHNPGAAINRTNLKTNKHSQQSAQ